MAKRRSAKQKANDRRLSGRSKTRSRSVSKVVRSRRKTQRKSFLPLTGEEMMIDGIASVLVAPISDLALPLQNRFIGNALGKFSDEVAIATVGTLANNMGKGRVKTVGKELFRIAWINTTGQLGSGIGKQISGVVSSLAPGVIGMTGKPASVGQIIG